MDIKVECGLVPRPAVPRARQLNHQVNDRTDRVLVAQIVVKPQVVNPLTPQPFQQPQCFLG